MKYVEYVNSSIKTVISKEEKLVIYGQNIDAASCLSGLTRGLSVVNDGFTINTPNSENTLTGIGFGLMLSGVSSIYFMKQMDFLLLRVDQLVNTYNVIRQTTAHASFTIFPVNVDSGYEGPQSALNNLNDFCSISGVNGFSMTNSSDTKHIIENFLIRPGFRIISPSQRLLREEMIEIDTLHKQDELTYFQYRKGDDVSVVCFNYSLPYGIRLSDMLREQGMNTSLWSVNAFLDIDYTYMMQDVNHTKRLVVIDDAKSLHKSSHIFMNEIHENCSLDESILVDRRNELNKYSPRHDQLEVPFEDIVRRLVQNLH